MNKSELVEILAEKAKITRKRAEAVVNLIFDSMTDALVRGERIEIRGFGSFTTKHYGAYTGRNPRTGETIHVPPKKLPFFKVGKELKERVDTGGKTDDTVDASAASEVSDAPAADAAAPTAAADEAASTPSDLDTPPTSNETS